VPGLRNDCGNRSSVPARRAACARSARIASQRVLNLVPIQTIAGPYVKCPQRSAESRRDEGRRNTGKPNRSPMFLELVPRFGNRNWGRITGLSKPLRAAHSLKPPVLPADIYVSCRCRSGRGRTASQEPARAAGDR
jgi:hypothetical protein